MSVMRLRSLLILSLLLIVITAPGVDAIACDDCGHAVALSAGRQDATPCDGQTDGDRLLTGAGQAAQETGTAADLCPVCANIAAAPHSVFCGAPDMVSQRHHLPKLLSFSSPSQSIIKPPQN